MDLLKRMIPIIDDHFIYEGELTLDTRFDEDFGADSLDVVAFMVSLEDEFGIEINEEDLVDLYTLGDAVKYIQKRLDELD